ncbi:uncharacterized protein TNCV_3453091 [Trichonephila clavipes]|nr:uncharacterized protein TNCV_3453091 [Trichonephila clavipes]
MKFPYTVESQKRALDNLAVRITRSSCRGRKTLKTVSGCVEADEKEVEQLTEKCLNNVRGQVKSAYQSNSAITDIDVTFDGTWLTRGHSSQIGVGCVIDLLTGFVMDFLKLCPNAALNVNTQNLVWEKIQQNFICGLYYPSLMDMNLCFVHMHLNNINGFLGEGAVWKRDDERARRPRTDLGCFGIRLPPSQITGDLT